MPRAITAGHVVFGALICGIGEAEKPDAGVTIPPPISTVKD